MTDLEIEIGRSIGASAFFVYQTIKANPGLTKKEIECETGLSTACVFAVVRKLVDSKVIITKEKSHKIRSSLYIENKEKELWKFH